MVAPLTMSMDALWAEIVSSISTGRARALICWSLPFSFGYCTTDTSVIRPSATVICTWTGPHRVCATGPVTVLAALAAPVVLLDEDADVPPDPVPPVTSPFDGAVAA